MRHPDIPGRYIYTPAELYDLSYSPLVAPPASFVKLAKSDLPGPPSLQPASERPSQSHQQSRRTRTGAGLAASNRRPDRHWAAGNAKSEFQGIHQFNNQGGLHSNVPHSRQSHSNESQRKKPAANETKETVEWLEISADDDAMGFGGFDKGVAAFEKWKHGQRNRAAPSAAPSASAETKESVEWLEITNDDTDTGFGNFDKGVAEFEKWKRNQRTRKGPQGMAEKEAEQEVAEETVDEDEAPSSNPNDTTELWESAINIPLQEGSNSRFSTFFQPSDESKQTNSTEQQTQRAVPSNPPLSHISSAHVSGRGTPQRTPSLPQGMPPQGMATQGMPPQGMAPQGMMPQGMSPQGMTPQRMTPHRIVPVAIPPGMNTQQSMPPGMMPQGMMPQGSRTQGMMPPGMVPPGMAPPGMYPPGMVMPGMSPQTHGRAAQVPRMAPPGMAIPPGMAPPPQNPQTPGDSSKVPPGMTPTKQTNGTQVADDAFFSGLLSKTN